MMSSKFIIRADRVRRVPRRFSWVDQRLVREGRLRELSHAASALYLLLVTVGDRNGMSWYSPQRLCLELGMDEQTLSDAREQLQGRQLIAYAEPFYQVLELCSVPQRCAAMPAASVRKGEKPATAEEVTELVNSTLLAWGPVAANGAERSPRGRCNG